MTGAPAAPPRRAVLYLPRKVSAALALRPTAGRPLLLRVLVAAARAGAAVIAVPAPLRTPAVERAIAGTRALRGRVEWLGGETPPAGAECWLLLPAAMHVDAAGLRALLEAGHAPLALGGSVEDGAPVLVAPASLVAALWPALVGGEPLGDRLAEIARAAPRRGAPAARAVHDEAGLARVEAWLYAHLTSGEDTTLDRLFHRRLSLPLTRLLVRLPITPNQVSLLSLVVGAGAIASLWHASAASAALGVALYAVASVIDHCDGELARLTFQESPLGAQLDWVTDTIIHSGLVLGIGVSAGGLLGAALGVLGAAGVAMSAVLARYLPDEEKAHSASPDRVLKDMGNRDLFYAVLVGFVLLRLAWPPGLVALALVVALGSQSYWLACLSRIRAARVRRPA